MRQVTPEAVVAEPLATASVPDGERRVHPTVRLDFVVRATTYPFFFVLYAVHLWPRDVPRWVWALLAGHLVVWPFAARLIASRSRDSKGAELRNLLVDAVVIGAYVPIAGFSIWPNVAGLVGSLAGNLSVGGARFAARGLVAYVFGASLFILVTRPTVDLRGASLLTEVLGIGMIVVYTTVFSLHSHVQSARNVRNLRRIREQSAQLDEKGRLLEERAHQVERARDAAEAANAAKSNFLANMSHELRTPLNAVIGYSEMLMEEAGEAGADALVPDLEKIRDSGRHLLGLINDVLDLSKIEAGRMELYLETFDVADLLASVTATVGPLVQRNESTLDVRLDEGLSVIRADLTRVRQILLNLLANAAKFTTRGRIELRASRASGPHGDAVVFAIADSGIGMTEAQLARLFRPFTQADDSTTRKYGGTGLGLTITKHFVEMMGGTIDVESAAGRGTTFTVRLPAEVAPSMFTTEMPVQNTGPRPVPDAALAGGAGEPVTAAATVLVIDDDPATRELVVRSLEREGFAAVAAATGEDGLRLARRLRPDAITLDVLMPGLDGWAVLRALKADPELSDIPVVMLSGAVEHALADGLGAVAHLRKPLDRAELVAALRDSTEPPSPGRGERVLLVEDDGVARELMRRTLERRGYTIVEAADGAEALECLDEAAPSLILLDLVMPRLDGFGFLEALRARAAWATVPVIVVSGLATTAGDRSRLQSATAFVQKGTHSAAELLRVVDAATDEHAGPTTRP